VADGRVNKNAAVFVHNLPITFHTLDSKASGSSVVGYFQFCFRQPLPAW
jgi:hypothetical protein